MTAPVWLLLSRYLRPLEEVDALRARHVAHLERQREAGRFLAWGRLVPPSGGFILGRGMDRATLDAVIAEDPFTAAGIAEWEVHELSLTGGAPDLLSLLAAARPA
jgi:uncharacterized protein YciI